MLNKAMTLGRKGVYDHLLRTVGLKHERMVKDGSKDVEDIKKAENQLTFLFKLKFSELNSDQQRIGKDEYLKLKKPPTSWEDYRALYTVAAKVKTN
jgi:hypothetical protein